MVGLGKTERERGGERRRRERGGYLFCLLCGSRFLRWSPRAPLVLRLGVGLFSQRRALLTVIDKTARRTWDRGLLDSLHPPPPTTTSTRAFSAPVRILTALLPELLPNISAFKTLSRADTLLRTLQQYHQRLFTSLAAPV